LRDWPDGWARSLQVARTLIAPWLRRS
jgi:hypothetical protein